MSAKIRVRERERVFDLTNNLVNLLKALYLKYEHILMM